jgi:hypothetical protein
MKLSDMDTRLLVLAALCAVGALLSAHQYYVLVLVDDTLKSQAAVEASFAAAIGVEGLARDPSAVRSASKSHADETSLMTRATQRLAASSRISQIAEGAIWIGLFVLAMLWIRRGPQRASSG